MGKQVKDLVKVLLGYKQDAEITNHEGEQFLHCSPLENGNVILSTERPIGYCNRSGGYAFLTNVEDYLAVVPELDENVDMIEIELPDMDEEENPSKFGKPLEIESKYKKAFYILLNEVKDSLPQESWDKLYKTDVDLEGN